MSRSIKDMTKQKQIEEIANDRKREGGKMREILFRGKRVDNGEWVYGYFVKMLWEYIIIPLEDENTVYPVEPETVGQYTGLTDKNGKKIFEGDIVEIDSIYGTIQPKPIRFEIEWEESSGFYPLTVCRDGGDYFIDTDYCEVIGNIYDNPIKYELSFEK